MSRPAPRSIDEYLKQLRASLEGEDPSLIQDALYDAEEYLRAEIAANAGKSEADVLELIASTYGAPDEVATAYRETEVKVKAALRTPPHSRAHVIRHPRPDLPILRGVSRPSRLHVAVLHAAGAGHGHRVLHVRRRGPCAVGRAARYSSSACRSSSHSSA